MRRGLGNLWTGLLAVLTICIICSAAFAEEWQLAFTDDFNRPDPGPRWSATGGRISIVEGALEIRSSGSGVAVLDQSFPTDVKVVYTAWTPSGVQRCDLTTIIGCDASGSMGGIFFGYGSWMDTLNHILKDWERELASSTEYLISQNERRHKIEAIKEGSRLSLTVDGRKILEAEDDDPCGGDGEDHVAFYTWSSAMRIDDLKIFIKGQPPHKPTSKELTLPIKKSEGGRLQCMLSNEPAALRGAVALYDARRYDDAFAALKLAPDTMSKAACMSWILGEVEFDRDRAGVTELIRCLENMQDGRATPQSQVLLRLARRFAVLCGAANGSRTHAQSKLLHELPEDHPFYDKVLLYRARLLEWRGRESGDQSQRMRAHEILKWLIVRHPNNRIIRMYLGEKIPWPKDFRLDGEGAPEWARMLCESYMRSLEIIKWWGRNRQSSNGSLGGGWGDDVELLRTWGLIAAITCGNGEAQQVIRRLADGVWNSDEVQREGYSCRMSDVEHSSEPTADTQPLMMLLDYGNPKYVERNMLTARLIRDRMMGRNSYGHWHWRSNQLAASGPSENPKYAVDVPYACRAFKHVNWLVWYGENPGAVLMLKEWARSWAEDTMRSGNGKPAGVVPAAVGFADDCLSGTSSDWTEPDLGWDYYNWNPGSWMYRIFMLAYRYSRDPQLLRPIMAALNYKRFAGPDVPGWVVERMCAEGAAAAAEAILTYCAMTGESLMAPLVKDRANTYERFLRGEGKEEVLSTIRKVRQGADVNFELLTSEVMATDRAGIWWADDLFRLYCGAERTWGDNSVPILSVRWASPTERFAAVVTSSSREALTAAVYSFEDKPLQMGFQTYRLRPGIYQMEIGRDVDSDWTMDEATRSAEIIIRDRGDMAYFELPSKQSTVVRLELKSPIDIPEGPLPDLAIGYDDVVRKGNLLKVKVHNIGGRQSGPFAVSLVSETGKTLARKKISGLGSPSDLHPKIAHVTLAVPNRTPGVRVVIDYSGPEVTTCNNSIRLIDPGKSKLFFRN